MNKAIRHTLKKRWSKKDLEKAEPFFSRDDTLLQKLLDHAILLSGSMLAAGLSFFLFPTLLVFNDTVLFLVMIVVTVSFGYLYGILSIDILAYEKQHHYLFLVLVPIVAYISMHLMTTHANALIRQLNLQTAIHNPFLIAGVFAAAIIAPAIGLIIHHRMKFHQ